MLTHRHIWNAIDRLAEELSLSPSALAKKAGLDPTSFNRSKRNSPDGRPRWPSTESIAKLLDATGMSMEAFMALTRDEAREPRYQTQGVPLIGFAQAGAGGFFDDGGFPVGVGWEQINLPQVNDEHAYALSVSGDSMLPLYREGDILIISPAKVAEPGDRVVVRTRDGQVMAKILVRQNADEITVDSLNPDHPPRTILVDDIEWIARIIWASQ